MRPFHSACLLLFVSIGLLLGQGLSPQEASRKMATPAGFTVSLVAAEPTVRQPVAIDFDDRGRLWVMQYLQYPNPAGLKRVAVDRYSRTVYDRIPEPPPHGPVGADELTILDSAGAKPFIKGLNLAPAFAFGHGGVFVLQVPYLLFYPDRNRDDVPDADPVVCLSGFGMEDAHSVANSLMWGPDGWLYGCQGSTVTARIRCPQREQRGEAAPPIEFQQGVWRYHPLTHRFELFCEGGGNSWGLDFNEVGDLFYSTNVGGHVLLHGVQGGYYWKAFGKHGPLHHRYAYGHFEHAPHERFTGGHVTVGGILYQGDTFPAAFRGKYIGADLLGHAVYWHTITAQGSSVRTMHGGELLRANDTWFAPSDVCLGPDGAVYVSDFHDARTAHPDPDAEWDRRNGRVFRIQSRDAKPLTSFDLGKRSTHELLALLDHPNVWYQRTARRLLADRRDPEVIPALRARLRDAPMMLQRLNALWALHVSGGFDEAIGVELLQSADAPIRRWAVRLLGDEERLREATLTAIMELAQRERTPEVCSQLACTARRIPALYGLAIIDALLASPGVRADDPHLPLLLWWAIESHTMTYPHIIEQRFATVEAWQHPILRDTILPRLLRRAVADGSSRGDALAMRLFAVGNAHRTTMLHAIDAGLGERGEQPLSPALRERLLAEWRARPDDRAALLVVLRLRERDALQQLCRRAVSSDRPLMERADALQLLAERGDESCWPLLLPIFDDASAATLFPQLLRAVQRDDGPIVRERLFRLYRDQPALRPRLAEVLLQRKDSALTLLRAIDAGTFPAADLPLDVLRGVVHHRDAMLDELVRKHWGTITAGTAEEKLAEIRRLNNDLRAASGDSTRGKLVFTRHCASCHQLFGEGQKIGPELTHANRKDRDYLLQSIVDPSVVIRKEYLAYTVTTLDGRRLTGMLVEQTNEALTLLDARNERIRIPKAQIDDWDESTTSLMPENLLKSLTPQELRDLFAYLQR